MGTIFKEIRKKILSWPNVTVEPHRFGGVEFRVNKRNGSYTWRESS